MPEVRQAGSVCVVIERNVTHGFERVFAVYANKDLARADYALHNSREWKVSYRDVPLYGPIESVVS